MDALKNFRLFPYYLNSRRISDITGQFIDPASQISLNYNSIARVDAMDTALRASRRLIYSGNISNLARIFSGPEISRKRFISFIWGIFTFSGASKALDLEKNGKKIINGKFYGDIPLGSREYRMSGDMYNDHYYSDSSISALSGTKRAFVLGHFDFSNEDNVRISPYVIGELVEDKYYAISLSDSIRVFPHMIDQFSKIKRSARPSKDDLTILEYMS